MDQGLLYDTLRQSLRVAAEMSLPILGAALVTGLVIGLLQALTSVQEMTLTFVPKLVAILIVFWTGMSGMTEVLSGFFEDRVIRAILES